MLEFEGKVRELLMAEGCEDSNIYRVGQKNTKVIKLEKNYAIDINDINDWKLAELIFKI